jgi:hypothetical protein
MKLANGDSTDYALGLSLGELGNMPVFSHGGEVSGFLSSNAMFPTRQGAVIVLSNEDVVDLVGPLARQIALTAFEPAPLEPSEASAQEVRKILSDLQQGKIDRSLFTANANSYFTEQALADCQASLGPFGSLKTVTPGRQNLRGGMTHRTYRAEFEKKTVNLNIYLLADGKYEQFLITVSA